MLNILIKPSEVHIAIVEIVFELLADSIILQSFIFPMSLFPVYFFPGGVFSRLCFSGGALFPVYFSGGAFSGLFFRDE